MPRTAGEVTAVNDEPGMFAGGSVGWRRRCTKGIQQMPLTIAALQTPLIAVVSQAARVAARFLVFLSLPFVTFFRPRGLYRRDWFHDLRHTILMQPLGL